jgi:hypothetical protein
MFKIKYFYRFKSPQNEKRMWCIEAKAKINIDLGIQGDAYNKEHIIIKECSKLAITKGKNEKFALWSNFGIFDLHKDYVGETIRVVSEK